MFFFFMPVSLPILNAHIWSFVRESKKPGVRPKIESKKRTGRLIICLFVYVTLFSVLFRDHKVRKEGMEG